MPMAHPPLTPELGQASPHVVHSHFEELVWQLCRPGLQQLLQVGVAHHGVPVHGLAGRGLSDTGPLGLPTGAATQTPEPSPYLTGHPGQSEARARGPGLHTLLPCLLLSPTDTETLTCRQGVGPWTRHSQAQPARSPCY